MILFQAQTKFIFKIQYNSIYNFIKFLLFFIFILNFNIYHLIFFHIKPTVGIDFVSKTL